MFPCFMIFAYDVLHSFASFLLLLMASFLLGHCIAIRWDMLPLTIHAFFFFCFTFCPNMLLAATAQAYLVIGSFRSIFGKVIFYCITFQASDYIIISVLFYIAIWHLHGKHLRPCSCALRALAVSLKDIFKVFELGNLYT